MPWKDRPFMRAMPPAPMPWSPANRTWFWRIAYRVLNCLPLNSHVGCSSPSASCQAASSSVMSRSMLSDVVLESTSAGAQYSLPAVAGLMPPTMLVAEPNRLRRPLVSGFGAVAEFGLATEM